MAKTVNKIKQNEHYRKVKKTREITKRDKQFSRKREEDKDPHLRVQRRARNVPTTIDSKRKWDVADLEEGDGIGLSVDVAALKRRKTETNEQAETEEGALTERNLKKVEALNAGLEADAQDEDEAELSDAASEDNDLASLMDDSSEGEQDDPEGAARNGASSMGPPPRPSARVTSPPASTTSTSISHIPDALAAKYPTLFHPPSIPKILVTTELGPNPLHKEAELLTKLFPNSTYIPRSGHRYRQHVFSLREVARFAQKRKYTTIVVLGEDNKEPKKLMVIHLPHASQVAVEIASTDTEADGQHVSDMDADTSGDAPPASSINEDTPDRPPLPKPGPTFHFSMNNFIAGSRLPGHGNPTIHYPELILNGFRTPLGLLTASLFRTLFPPAPEIAGRQVVTLHNQRDYIFVRRHRYVFRERKGTERQVVDVKGEVMKGAEDVKAGLQELGPRFTLKLRRVEGGIHREKFGQSEWEWKAGMEKERTRFSL